MSITEAIEQHAIERIEALEQITGGIVSAHVTIAADETADPEMRFTASARLEISGPDVFAEEHAADLYIALDGVASKLGRQLRKRKTQRTDKRRQTAQRAAESERLTTT
jgi:putative sigma-54 modulation protein